MTDTTTHDADDHPDGVHWNRNNCLAIVGTTGLQCSSTAKKVLCGTHSKSRSVTRVDEFDTAPNEDLRDDLVDECGMDGPTAFALATAADDIEDIWHLVTGLQDVEIGSDEWSGRRLAMKAEEVAKHPDLDVDGHPLAEDHCAAFPASPSSVSERCSSGGHGPNLMCGLHMDAADPETIYDDEHLDDLEAVPLAESVELFEDSYRHDDVVHEPGTEFVLVEERGDDAIVVTPELVLERIPMDCLEADSNAESGDRPALFARVSEGDDVRLRLENNGFVSGTVKELHESSKQFAALVETESEWSVPVIANPEDDGWGPCDARDEENVEDLGEVVGVLVLEETVSLDEDLTGADVVLVGCGDAKTDLAAPAKELYTSNYFAKKRAYGAEADAWLVLSAKYGLVDPAEVVKPYDRTLADLDDDELRKWDLLVSEQLPDLSGADVEILAGADYADPVRETAEMYVGTEGSVSTPTSGGIGERMAWLDEHTGEETEDVQEGATFICSDCGDVVENSPMPMHTCAFCGGEMVHEVDYDPVDEDAVEQRRELLEEAGLTPKQAEVMAYKDETDLSHADIGDQMGIAKGTVDRHSARAQDAIGDVDERIEDLQEKIEQLQRLKSIANNASIVEFAE